jgi:DNA-binding NarL/FixJ family response regulator
MRRRERVGGLASFRPVRERALNVLAIADSEMRRRRLASIVEDGGFAVAVRAPGPSALEGLNGRPDVFVLGYDRFDEAAGWLPALRAAHPAAAAVVVGIEGRGKAVRTAIAAGVDGFVIEADAEHTLVDAIRAAASGQLVLPGTFRSYIARPVLSTREKQVLALVVMGLGNREIADSLFVAESTVKSHLSSVFRKLGVRSRNEAATLILDPDQGLGVGVLEISGNGS